MKESKGDRSHIERNEEEETRYRDIDIDIDI
jgi:hypothetical protein